MNLQWLLFFSHCDNGWFTVLFFYPVYGQAANTSNNTTTSTNGSEPLPVLLIHGYMSDASVWEKMGRFAKERQYSCFSNYI